VYFKSATMLYSESAFEEVRGARGEGAARLQALQGAGALYKDKDTA
jgi:hypothetical protein